MPKNEAASNAETDELPTYLELCQSISRSQVHLSRIGMLCAIRPDSAKAAWRYLREVERLLSRSHEMLHVTDLLRDEGSDAPKRFT